MRILLYSINYAPELTATGKYNGEMCRWLTDRGHKVKVLTAPPYYPAWKLINGYQNWFKLETLNGVQVQRCPLYIPSRLSTIKRLLHLGSFAISSLWGLWRSRSFKPDIVIIVEPTLFCAPAGLLFSRIAGAKSLLHIQDYEIDAMLGLGLMRNKTLSLIAKSIDSYLMRRFDRVSSISKTMITLAEKKGVSRERIWLFPNWVDINHISPAADKMRFRQHWGINPNSRVVMYSGNMGKKQGLELVIQAAEAFKHNKEVVFLMVGQGAAHAELYSQAKEAKLTNIRFEPPQSFTNLPDLLAMADVHLIVQKKGAADVVLPSKLTGILSIGGHALITAEANTQLGQLCQEHPGIATCIEPESLPAFIKGLKMILATDTKKINHVARDYAVKFLNQDLILSQFEKNLIDLADAK